MGGRNPIPNYLFGWCLKPCKEWGFQLPTSTGERQISEPSTVGLVHCTYNLPYKSTFHVCRYTVRPMDVMGYVLDTKKDPKKVLFMLDFWGVHASDESEFSIREYFIRVRDGRGKEMSQWIWIWNNSSEFLWFAYLGRVCLTMYLL